MTNQQSFLSPLAPALCALLVTLSALALPAQARSLQVETVAEGLEHPWSVAFLPDGRWLVTERAGRLRVIQNGALLAKPVSGVPEAYVRSQGGLLGVLPAQDFAQSGVIYLSLAHGDGDANGTRVVRGVLAGNALTNVTPIFTASPLKDTPVHYGGRMTWMKDGTLLLTLGDGFDYREAAQQLDNHFGKIVRMNADGSVPGNNPFANRDDALPHIYTYGNRNVQGLVVEPTTGRVYAHEHGPRGGDELNLIQPGKNYGWPAITYGIDYSGAVISPHTSLPGMEQPLVHWVPSIAPAGMALYRGDMFGDWQGDLLIASLAERSLRRIELRPDGRVLGQHKIDTGLNVRLRDVAVAPDGAVILLTDSPEGKVLRLTPTSAE